MFVLFHLAYTVVKFPSDSDVIAQVKGHFLLVHMRKIFILKPYTQTQFSRAQRSFIITNFLCIGLRIDSSMYIIIVRAFLYLLLLSRIKRQVLSNVIL